MTGTARLTLFATGIALLASPAAAQQFDVMEATIPGVHAALDARRLTCRALVQEIGRAHV